MNKKTLMAGLIGFIVGAASIPDYGWLLGAVLGSLVGQLLHINQRLQQVESQLSALKQKKEALDPRPPQPPPEAPKSLTAPVPPAASMPPQPKSETAAAARAADHLALREPGAFQSGIFDKALVQLRRFLFEGNPIVRVGMVVMLFGLSFLVKYAANAGFFPIHLRLAIIALVAMVLLVIGWRTRGKENGYGLVLQGGGVAALYLTVFAATKLYPILPPGFAFLLMLLIVSLGVVLAVLQNAQVLALMATAGGFLAPILSSDGSGSHVLLFTFYLLLNLGVLGVAVFKTWRWLNWLGFVFTFGISSAWGVLTYEPHLFRSTQGFLLAFFLLYLCVSVLFSVRQPVQRRGLVDGSLVFGLPIVSFALQAALLGHTDYGLAISALVLAALYLALASAVWKAYGAAQHLLVESFIALGIGFATVAIPLALDADWTSAAWALEAAGLIWVGLRQQGLLPRIAGYGLYVAAVLSIFIGRPFETGPMPIVSGDFIGFVILSWAAFAIAYLLLKHAGAASRVERRMQWLPISLGLLWWLVAGLNEIGAHIHPTYYFAAFIVFVSASFAGLLAIAYRLSWRAVAKAGYALLPLTIFIILPFLLVWLIELDNQHPAANVGLPALLLFALVHYVFLWRERGIGISTLLPAWHVITSWLWLLLLFWEAAYWQKHLGLAATTSLLLWFVCFAGPLVLLMAVIHKPRWPFNLYQDVYRGMVPIPLVLLLLLWFLLACQHSGATSYLHLPVINPLDLSQLAAIIVLVYAAGKRLAGLHQLELSLRYGCLAALTFVWISVVVMRGVHHYSPVPYELGALWNSATLQMALSIVWTLGALAVMLGTRRLQSRIMWMAGAGLLLLVVIKLFTKDLTGSGTLPRVISFMAVGALMLLIGYLAPMPAGRSAPRIKEAAL